MHKKTKPILIVCPPSMKETAIEIESNYQELQNIKIMSTTEIKELLFFKITKKLIVYLCEKYDLAITLSKNIIDYLYYIDIEEKYVHQKLIYLQNIKKDLIANGIIKENNLFIKYLKTVDVVFRYFSVETKKDTWLYNKLSEITNVNNESYTTLEYREIHTINEFDTLENECIYLFDSFASLLDNGIPSDKIILLNSTESSYFTLERLSKFYNIALDLPSNTKVTTTPIGKEFLMYLKNLSVQESLNIIKEKYANDKDGILIYNQILNTINQYAELENFDKYKKYIIYDLNTINIPKTRVTNAIKIKDFSSYTYKDGDYVFIMNVNYGVFPKISKDEDFLPDYLKLLIGMASSSQKNEERKKEILNKVPKLGNPILTYHLATPFENSYPSFLNETVNQVIKNPSIKSPFSYSVMKDMYKYKKLKEDKNFNDSYFYLHSHLNSLIHKYDPSYIQIPSHKIKEYYQTKKGLQLSYTSMNTYYQCKYRFFVQNVLKITENNQTFEINIGKIFHEVLSHIYDKNFDFEQYFSLACNKYDFNIKEKFLLSKLKEELLFDIQIILEHYNENSLFKNQTFEKEITVNYESKDIPLRFKGIIDKTMWYEDNDGKFIAIIDYKTGNPSIDLDTMKQGVGLQLPVYLYLASKNEKNTNFKFVGFYLQKILADEKTRVVNKTRYEIRRDSLKLEGFSCDDTSILSKFDFTYTSSDFIKSMRIKNDGSFYNYVKTMSQEDMFSYINLVDEKISNAFKEILNANFEINPLEIIRNNKKENIGCQYCEFKDICYKTYQKEEK